MFQKILSAIALFLAFASTSNAAIVSAFDNTANGGASDPILTSDVTQHALLFDAGATGSLVDIDVSLRAYATPTGSLTFNLYSDGGTAPGILLDTSNTVNLTTTTFTNFSVGGWNGAELVSGSRYWLVAELISGSALWEGVVGTGTMSRAYLTSSWTLTPGSVVPVANINVDDDLSDVPLPASGVLLIVALGLLGIKRRSFA